MLEKKNFWACWIQIRTIDRLKDLSYQERMVNSLEYFTMELEFCIMMTQLHQKSLCM